MCFRIRLASGTSGSANRNHIGEAVRAPIRRHRQPMRFCASLRGLPLRIGLLGVAGGCYGADLLEAVRRGVSSLDLPEKTKLLRWSAAIERRCSSPTDRSEKPNLLVDVLVWGTFLQVDRSQYSSQVRDEFEKLLRWSERAQSKRQLPTSSGLDGMVNAAQVAYERRLVAVTDYDSRAPALASECMSSYRATNGRVCTNARSARRSLPPSTMPVTQEVLSENSFRSSRRTDGYAQQRPMTTSCASTMPIAVTALMIARSPERDNRQQCWFERRPMNLPIEADVFRSPRLRQDRSNPLR